MKCYVCEAEDFGQVPDFKGLPRVTSDAKPFRKGGNLAHCLHCGLIQKNMDSVMSQELDEIYSHYTSYHQSKNDTQTIFIQENPISRCKFLLNSLRPFIESDKFKSFLDFGCGAGSFLKEVNIDLPEVDLYAFDLDDKSADSLHSLSSFKMFFTGDYKSINRKFSLITLIHSLEHIHNPREVLFFIKENLLEEGGYLFVQVPNVEKNPFDLLVADHLSHFTEGTLSNLMNSVGFKKKNDQSNWIEKEISFLVTKATSSSQDVIPDFSFSKNLHREVENFYSIITEAKQISETKKSSPFGIFGTSIASTWLATSLNGKMDFFVDEDLNRIGKNHLGKPVLSPNKLNGGEVYIPFPKEIAMKIYRKSIEKEWKFSVFFPTGRLQNSSLKNHQVFGAICSQEELGELKDFLRKELIQIHKVYEEKFNIDLSAPRIFNYFEDVLNKEDLSVAEKQIIRGQFPLSVRLNDIIVKFGCRLGTLLSEKLEEKLEFMHMPPMARFVYPHNKCSMVPPHSDKDYNDHMKKFITAWVPLTAISPEMGGLRFYHSKDTVKPTSVKKEDLSRWHSAIENLENSPFTDVNHVAVGDVVVFDQDSIHASLPNISETTRFSLDYRFFSSETRSSKSFINIHTKELTLV